MQRRPEAWLLTTSQLVLDANRVLFSSFTAEVCPGYTPPHDKQLLLIGIKVAPVRPYYLLSQVQDGRNWCTNLLLMVTSATPLSGLVACLVQQGESQKAFEKSTDSS